MVRVSEEGTEAAAATLFATRSFVRTIHVNNPFMFFIKHRASGVMLFMGRVVCPDPEQCGNAGISLARLGDPGAADHDATSTAHCQGLACEDEAIKQPRREYRGHVTESPPTYSRASIGESETQWSVFSIVWPMSYLGYTVYN